MALLDGMLRNLADKFHKFKTQIFRHLAENGLGMDVDVVNTCLQSNTDNKMAMCDLLKEWRESQPDRKVAYTNLHDTLLKENMDDLTRVLVGIISYIFQSMKTV